MELNINGLCKTYPNGAVGMDQVSLHIPRGVFGLLGPNGAGKTTLMRTLATLQDPDRGVAHLGEVDLIKNKTAARELIGYLPQDFGLYPQLTAEEMLDHIAVLKGLGPARVRRTMVDQMLSLTNLQEHRNKKLGACSGGMRQRFGIAQATIGSPKLLIVDEPTAGLDPLERNRFHQLLARISEDIVVILSTHIVEDVGDLCPNMAIMNRGRVIAGGRPGDLRAELAGRLWRARLSAQDADEAADRWDVVSTRLVEGVREVHVIGNQPPNEAFTPCDPDLQDVYFARLFQDRRRGRVVPAA